MSTSLVMGSRSSKLAMAQTGLVRDAIADRFPDLDVRIEQISTTGDRERTTPLARIGGQGLFTKEIEEALLSGRIDLAVHSLKDLPTRLPEGLVLAAVSAREDPHDVLICRDGGGLDDLPSGAVVGTSSLRRRAQLLACRSDLDVRDIRGNLDTRLRKLSDEGYDAIVVARAGLLRLGVAPPAAEILSYDVMLPAVGQGALGIETRADDSGTRERVAVVHDEATACCVRAERAFLAALEGGCQVPIGAVAEVTEGELLLHGLVSALDGGACVRGEQGGRPDRGESVGEGLARRLLEEGGEDILRRVRADGG